MTLCMAQNQTFIFYPFAEIERPLIPQSEVQPRTHGFRMKWFGMGSRLFAEDISIDLITISIITERGGKFQSRFW